MIEHNGVDKPTFNGKHRPWILKAVFSCGISEVESSFLYDGYMLKIFKARIFSKPLTAFIIPASESYSRICQLELFTARITYKLFACSDTALPDESLSHESKFLRKNATLRYYRRIQTGFGYTVIGSRIKNS